MTGLATPSSRSVPSASRTAGEEHPRGDGALFAQLVWAHHRWERERRRSGESERKYRKEYLVHLDRFEQRHGRLEHVYWCTSSPSAVAMTVKSPVDSQDGAGRRFHRAREWIRRRLPRLLERDDEVRLHRLSDWVTRDAPEIADLLQECDLLAIRVGEVLRGTSERIAMRMIVGIQEHLLGFFERSAAYAGPPEADEGAEADEPARPAVAHVAGNGAARAPRAGTPAPDGRSLTKQRRDLVVGQRRKLEDVESYYHKAASKAGRIVYFSGMLIGFLGAIGLALLAASLLWILGLPGPQLEMLSLCYGAGAVGAMISVMSRMSHPERRSFDLDFELGRPLMRRLGLFRPFVGAVMGVALYLLLESGLLDLQVTDAQKHYYYGFAAFLSGFSERFANVVFGAAEQRLGGGSARAEQTAPAA